MIQNLSLLKKLIIFSVAINLIVPYLLRPFASEEEIKPSNGASSLNLKEQIMHMFVHHAQVPFSSSLIIVIIVALAMFLSERY